MPMRDPSVRKAQIGDAIAATGIQAVYWQDPDSGPTRPQASRNPAVRPRDHPAPAPSSSLSPAHATHALPLSLSLSTTGYNEPIGLPARVGLCCFRGKGWHSPRHIPAPSGSSSASLQSRQATEDESEQRSTNDSTRGRWRTAPRDAWRRSKTISLDPTAVDCWRPGTGRDSDAQVLWEDGKSPRPTKEEPTNRRRRHGGGGFSLLLIWSLLSQWAVEEMLFPANLTCSREGTQQ